MVLARKPSRSSRSSKKITILDIDVQGVISVKESGIPAKYVFIAPPSMEELEARLRGRGTETEEAITKRLGNAQREIDYGTLHNFDQLFVNRDVEKTVDEMVKVMLEWYPQLKSDDGYCQNTPESGNEEKVTTAATSLSRPQQKSDNTMFSPSVRKGDGEALATDRSTTARRHFSYTVELEELGGSHSHPKKINPNDDDVAN